MDNIISLTITDEIATELGKKDDRINKLISLVGCLNIAIRENRFEALVRSIIGQQISISSARTIYTKMQVLCGKVRPESLYGVSSEELRKAGVSKPKISFIKDLSEKVLSGEMDLYSLDDYSSDEIISILTKVKGIGTWTAQMFLIFSLGRLDIVALGDAGLQRACKWLYYDEGNKDAINILADKAIHWRPYGTVASLYLWEAINKGYVDKFNSINECIQT